MLEEGNTDAKETTPFHVNLNHVYTRMTSCTGAYLYHLLGLFHFHPRNFYYSQKSENRIKEMVDESFNHSTSLGLV